MLTIRPDVITNIETLPDNISSFMILLDDNMDHAL